jgi:hypothetical protein
VRDLFFALSCPNDFFRNLLHRNTLVADELRRTFPEIDRMEKEIGKAAKAIQSVSALVVRYRERLRELCDSVANAKVPSK